MKRLGISATIFALLVLFFVFVAFPVYAATWVSYEDSDHQTECNNFVAGKEWVYMQGGGFTVSHEYKVAYYEADTGGGDEAYRVNIDIKTSNAGGILESKLYFPDYQDFIAGADEGTWHAVVYDATDSPPSIYDSDDPDIEADDSFYVHEEAIPEFPTVITMIVAMGLCVGIYYWMRKRYHRQVVTA